MDQLPPYFNISPETAYQTLSGLESTKDFQHITMACEKGQNDLTQTGLHDTGKRQLRLFSTWEITKYLIPVAQAHFRRVLRQNPTLPQGTRETKGAARWFTLEDVLRLRAHFEQEGVKAKEYRPYRPPGVAAKVITLANSKGGVGKTTTCAHLAMSAALDGYKVLIIDLDGQATISRMFGAQIKSEWQTAFPLMTRHYGGHLRTENQRRHDRGDPPIPFADTLQDAMDIHARDVIQTTHWPNIDVIGGQLKLHGSELQIASWRMNAPSWKYWNALSDMIRADQLLLEYDLIFIDTPSALGYLSINALVSADILLVPTGASAAEYDGAKDFFDMLYTVFTAIEEDQNIAARALGHEELSFAWDAIRMLITRFDPASQMELASLMQSHLGQTLSPFRQDFSALLQQTDSNVNGIYETDYRDFSREVYARERTSFDNSYAVFKRLLYGIWYRDERALRQAQHI